nr:uncharacterized protein LOC123568675 [Macaca fascicularis]
MLAALVPGPTPSRPRPSASEQKTPPLRGEQAAKAAGRGRGKRPQPGPALHPHPRRARLKASKAWEPIRPGCKPPPPLPGCAVQNPTSVTWPSQHPPSHFLEDLCGLGRKFVPSDKAEDNEGGATRPEALREETVPASRSWTPPGDPARCHSAEAGHAWSLQVPPALPQPSYNAHRAAGSGFRQETA